MEISTIIAVTSLIMAITTFYLSNLQSAKITSKVGPFIKVYYADYDSGGSFGLYIPSVFINTASKVGVILNAAITLNKNDSPEQLYFLQWKEFAKLDVALNKWVYEEMAHAFAITGKSTSTKIVWYMWNSGSQPKLVLREGSYTLSFYFWEKENKAPNCETHEFHVSEDMVNTLEGYRAQKKSTTFDIRLDREIDENRLMTHREMKKLLQVRKNHWLIKA